MTTANTRVAQILLKRGNTTQSGSYVGPLGEVTLDTDLDTLRIHDGVTPGGFSILATKSDIDQVNSDIGNISLGVIDTAPIIANVQAAVQSTINANVTAANLNIARLDANLGTATTTITSLLANAVTQEGHITSLTASVSTISTNVGALVANAAAQEVHINLLNANITAANAAIALLQGNASTQSTELIELLSNASAQHNSLVSLLANAAVQAEYLANLDIATSDRLVNGSYEAVLGADGSLTLPGTGWIKDSIGRGYINVNTMGNDESIVSLGSNSIDEMVTSTIEIAPNYGIGLTSVRNVDITAGYDSATLKYGIWVNAEQVWTDIRDQDAQIIAPETRTWAGLPSYQAYPLLMEFMQNIPNGEIPPSNAMAQVANTAKTAYEIWQVEQSSINVNVTVKDKTWTFGNDGQLTVPGAIFRDGGLYMNSSGSTTAASVFVSGYAGSVILRTADNAQQVSYDLTLDSTGETTLPGNLILPGGATLSSDSINGFTISQLALDEETTLSVNFGRGGHITVPLSIEFNHLGTPIGGIAGQPDDLTISASPNKGVIIAPNDGANGYWTFGTNGYLTAPTRGAVIIPNIGGLGWDSSNDEDFNLIVNSENNTKIQTSLTNTWEFDTTGNLTLPQTNFDSSPAPTSWPGITYSDGSFQNTAFTLNAGNTAPGTGIVWFNTQEARMYVKYNEQWVDASPTVLTPPDTNPTVESVTFNDATVQTTAWPGTLSYNDLTDKPVTPAFVGGGNAATWLTPN